VSGLTGYRPTGIIPAFLRRRVEHPLSLARIAKVAARRRRPQRARSPGSSVPTRRPEHTSLRSTHMNLRCYCGMVVALALGLGLAFTASAQDTATPAEVTAAPEAEPAPAEVLTDAHGPALPGDAAAGEAKSAVCAACHGMDGNSMIPMYPKLAGQHEAYAARQLAMFQDGTRVDPVMLGMSAGLTPQDMRDLGAYYATLTITAGIADDSKLDDGRSF